MIFKRRIAFKFPILKSLSSSTSTSPSWWLVYDVWLQRYMQQHNEVELSALGMAIATVVSVAEILKNNGLAVEKRIVTSTVEIKDDSRGRPVQKAKIEIVLGKSAKFDELMAASQEERENEGKVGQSGNVEEQS
ncbi:uncharacterized protein At2g34160-like isoform X2 [Coffea arabica]|uniref:Uncharacterized protein At2g34160-like isoform X2 n=1 Tax=Coffea arabica TaxID=13443 RepID=A0A6P6XCF4_COFAR|nr:uncharacterized protein At2g34160-like isoform X2 [Coffea arabica]XP_027125443.1 uncharacterized protein At2g34160-like isoform X2 [Coffea arabica]